MGEGIGRTAKASQVRKTHALVSAVMPTANRRRFIPQALKCFLGQTYPAKELVVLDDGESIEDLLPRHPEIRYYRCEEMVLGEKQNACCERARGDIIIHWDDDDWSDPTRMQEQVETLKHRKVSLTGYYYMIFYDESTGQIWRSGTEGDYAFGNSLCYYKEYWSNNRFPPIHVGYDGFMVSEADLVMQLGSTSGESRMVAIRHTENASSMGYCRNQHKELSYSSLPELFRRNLETGLI